MNCRHLGSDISTTGGTVGESEIRPPLTKNGVSDSASLHLNKECLIELPEKQNPIMNLQWSNEVTLIEAVRARVRQTLVIISLKIEIHEKASKEKKELSCEFISHDTCSWAPFRNVRMSSTSIKLYEDALVKRGFH